MDEFAPISDYSYSTTNSAADASVAIGMFIFIMVMAAIVYVVSSLLLSSVFKKAGVAPWKAWVPVLNNWKTLEIGGQQGFWAILAFVPIVNIASVIFIVIAMHNINRKLGYDVGMTVLAIFLPLIWLIIIATSKKPWNEHLGAPRTDRPDVAPSAADYPAQAPLTPNYQPAPPVEQSQPGQQPPVPPTA